MNEKMENPGPPHEDELRFDRLVDGELSAEEYRALLASLDDEPGGWRRCALAFVESQALAGELGNARRSLDLSAAPSDSGQIDRAGETAVSARNRFGPFELQTLLAMAASFLVAFALGVVLPRWWPQANLHGPAVAELPTKGSGPGVDKARPAIAGGNRRHDTFRPVANVQLVVDGPTGESTQVGELPMYEMPGSIEQWLAESAPALSPDVIQSLKERGHEIKRHVQYVPVQLEDGRQGIVPVENYQITPVSQRAY
jgi:hypothetical protein